jgi:hypothetical protein
MLGKLYHVAPWPVGSNRKALKFFRLAVETDDSVLYSHYYVGLLYYKKKAFDLAEKEFKFVKEESPNKLEKHFIDTYKKEVNKYLVKIEKRKQK